MTPTQPSEPTAPADAGARPATFALMFVCTGNMCRSPMGERMARSVLRRALGADAERFRVYSGGTGTRDGRNMTPEAIRVVRAYGADPDGFSSSEITEEAIRGADLVLTATRAHRADVVTMEPTALRRCFTMTEFARTAGSLEPAINASAREPDDSTDNQADDPVERARSVVAAAARRRGTVPPEHPDDDDIPDPIGRPMEVYEASGKLVALAVEDAINALVGTRA